MIKNNHVAGETLFVSIGEINKHPKNVRIADIGLIEKSIKVHGQYAPIIVNLRTKYIVKGNHVYEACRNLNYKEVLVRFIDVDESQEIEILLIDNRTSDGSTYDEDELLNLINGIPNLENTGFSNAEIKLIGDRAELALKELEEHNLEAKDYANMPKKSFLDTEEETIDPKPFENSGYNSGAIEDLSELKMLVTSAIDKLKLGGTIIIYGSDPLEKIPDEIENFGADVVYIKSFPSAINDSPNAQPKNKKKNKRKVI